jgi:hypothetical protein
MDSVPSRLGREREGSDGRTGLKAHDLGLREGDASNGRAWDGRRADDSDRREKGLWTRHTWLLEGDLGHGRLTTGEPAVSSIPKSPRPSPAPAGEAGVPMRAAGTLPRSRPPTTEPGLPELEARRPEPRADHGLAAGPAAVITGRGSPAPPSHQW